MSDMVDDGKRGFLKQAALFGAASGAVGAAMAPDVTLAQMLETGVRDDSVLAKCRKEGVLRVGYAQTGPWFYKDAKTGELNGIYKDVVEQLAKEIQVKVEWKEVTFANATIALRRGDFDLFGSSLTYLVPRAIAVDFVGPYYSKGSLLLCHKDNAERFKTAADANKAGRHVLGHVGRERGAAHSAAVPGQAEGHHDDRPGLARRRAGARQEGRRVDQRRQRRDPAGEAQRKLGACDRSGQSARPAPEHAGGALRRSGVEEASSTSTASS